MQLEVATDVRPEDVFVVDPGPLKITEIRVLGPNRMQMLAAAPHAGRYTVRLGYLTQLLTWTAAYTLTTTAARKHGVLRGTLAVTNATGIGFTRVRLSVVDADQILARERAADRLAVKPVKGTPSGPVPRELGIVDLGAGNTRVELLPALQRELRAVLVYDPIGTRLDRNLEYPVRDASLGIHPPATPQVTESLELRRDGALTAGLPGGSVRLFERRADGTLAALGEARMFESATRVADSDLLPVRTAEGVSGSRARRELTVDDDNARIVEELEISIENRRAHPIEVVLREHLYRNQTWHLAYYSSYVIAKQEGAQQISLRIAVPARTKSKVLYVVVYPWKKAQR
ncbi:MAG: hypothetical protein WKG01_05375 [Kofleriaceae bacterium]